MSISRKSQELIEDLPLRIDDSWYILLIYLGLKSGAWVNLLSDIWREGDDPRSVPESRIQDLRNTLKELGLKYAIERRETSAGIWQPNENEPLRTRLNEIVDIYVAKDQAVLDAIILARKNNDHKSLGLALGYPKTAVDAFKTDSALMAHEADLGDSFTDTVKLTYFALSEQNWEDELKVVESWIEAARSNSSIMWNSLRHFARIDSTE